MAAPDIHSLSTAQAEALQQLVSMARGLVQTGLDNASDPSMRRSLLHCKNCLDLADQSASSIARRAWEISEEAGAGW
jgi:hypothetical protein